MQSKTPSVKKSGTALEYDQIRHSRQTITWSQQFLGSSFRSISKGYEVLPTFGITVDNRGFDSEGLTIRDLLNEQTTPAKAMRTSLSKRFLTLAIQWFCSYVTFWYISFPFFTKQ